MEFFRDSKIDFMKYRKYFVVVSLVLLLISVLAVFVAGKLNLGVDFAGGTQVTVKFSKPQEMNDLRAMTAAAGIEDAQIQSFGDPGDNEALIRTSLVPGQEEGTQQVLLDALVLKQTYIDKKRALLSQIRAVDATGKTYAQTKAELDAIVW